MGTPLITQLGDISEQLRGEIDHALKVGEKLLLLQLADGSALPQRKLHLLQDQSQVPIVISLGGDQLAKTQVAYPGLTRSLAPPCYHSRHAHLESKDGHPRPLITR
jgi:hypothetical protein